ncbi:MAG: response regulator [Pseudomonadota bacterium]|nr:response regulator [Pseudomonadota bacterium]
MTNQKTLKTPHISLDDNDGRGVSIGRDITPLEEAERKTAQLLLEKSEQRLQLALEGADLGMWDWDLQTNDLYFSPRYLSMLGYGPTELPHTAATWENLLHPEEKKSVKRQLLGAIFQGSDSVRIEFSMRAKDGNYRWILGQGKVVERAQDGSPLRVSGTHLDITKLKNLETQLVQSQKMEAIGTLAGGIAHDFNNILTSILGFSELAQLALADGSSAEKEIDQVIISAKRAAELVQQILTFSRKEPKKVRRLKPHLIVKETLKMLHSSLPATIKIEEDIDIECVEIKADPTHLHQIVMNLCTNALQSMQEQKGVLQVKLEHREITAQDNAEQSHKKIGSFIVLSISDTGSGINQATITRIFEPYFTTKEFGKGTGLGLSVVHGIVESYNGFIKVESKLGQGTTFHIYLPSLKKNSVTPQQKESRFDNLAPGSERILIVDDEEAILNLHETLLTRLGYEVTATTSSQEALALITANPNQFDLIITDQSMPNISGAELASETLKIRSTMPIILCTGYSSVISENDALAIGIKKYVEKPVSIKDLAEIVRQILDESLIKPS